VTFHYTPTCGSSGRGMVLDPAGPVADRRHVHLGRGAQLQHVVPRTDVLDQQVRMHKVIRHVIEVGEIAGIAHSAPEIRLCRGLRLKIDQVDLDARVIDLSRGDAPANFRATEVDGCDSTQARLGLIDEGPNMLVSRLPEAVAPRTRRASSPSSRRAPKRRSTTRTGCRRRSPPTS
jgi:hypothetical protein